VAGTRVVLLLCLCSILHTGCGQGGDPATIRKERPIRPINDVLDDHAPGLMKIDGVVGVYAGVLDDGAPCLVIMLRDDGAEKRGELPESLEGYPVRLEVGGEIRPLKP